MNDTQNEVFENLDEYVEERGPLTADELIRLNNLALELQAAQSRVAELEDELKKARDAEGFIATQRLPEAIQDLGLEHGRPIPLPCGKSVKVEDMIRASISERNQSAAFEWLDENGHGGIIKRQVVVAFDKGREAQAFELAKSLRDTYPVKLSGSVHSGTLKKFVRERLDEGTQLPDSISVFRIPTAKLS